MLSLWRLLGGFGAVCVEEALAEWQRATSGICYSRSISTPAWRAGPCCTCSPTTCFWLQELTLQTGRTDQRKEAALPLWCRWTGEGLSKWLAQGHAENLQQSQELDPHPLLRLLKSHCSSLKKSNNQSFRAILVRPSCCCNSYQGFWTNYRSSS